MYIQYTYVENIRRNKHKERVSKGSVVANRHAIGSEGGVEDVARNIVSEREKTQRNEHKERDVSGAHRHAMGSELGEEDAATWEH